MVGVILAGGAGRRMGGAKAARELAGRPLLEYAARAVAAVCEPVAIVCKPGTELAGAPFTVWDDEPTEPRHPATGIAHALRRAGGRVLVCAADMPFVSPATCARLVASAESRSAAAVVAAADAGRVQPVLAVYAPSARGALVTAAERGEPLRRAVEALQPVLVDLPALELRSVDTPEALAAAERELLSRAP